MRRLRRWGFPLTFLLIVTAMYSCEPYFDYITRYGTTTVTPTEAVLVVGRDDTLIGSVTFTWPREIGGNFRGGAVWVWAKNSTGTTNNRIGFDAFPRYHDGDNVQTESSTWKMWLIPNTMNEPLEFRLKIGDNRYDGEGNYRDIHGTSSSIFEGGSIRLVVLTEDLPFALRIEPDTARQSQGSTATRTVRLIRAPGFTASVQFTLYQPPAGITATFNPPSVSGDTSFMQLSVDDLVAPDKYPLKVIATGGGSSDTTGFVVDVVAAQYSVVLNPNTLSLAPGQIGQATMNVSGPHLPVTLIEPIEPHVSIQFSPNPTSNTSTMTVTVQQSAQVGTRRIPIIGRFSNGQTARDSLTLTITSGTGWTQVLQASTLYGMDVDDGTQTGLAVGFGNTYRSTDGGRNWAMGAPIDTLLNTYESVSLKGPRAVAVGFGGAAAVSVDGGVTWTRAFTGTSRALYGVSFSDIANGVAVGEGIILRTTNGGSNWSVVPVIGDPYVFLDVSYNFGSAFAAGLNGVIFRSTNYQDNWTQLASGTTMDLWGVSFKDANNGIAVGNGGTILITSDGGSSWVQRNIPQVSSRLDKVYMLSPTIATVGGFGAVLYQTFNSGQTWTRDMTSLPFFERVKDIHLSQDNKGVCLVQNNQQTNTGTILRRE